MDLFVLFCFVLFIVVAPFFFFLFFLGGGGEGKFVVWIFFVCLFLVGLMYLRGGQCIYIILKCFINVHDISTTLCYSPRSASRELLCRVN